MREYTVSELSFHLERKRQRMRDLLQQRHIASIAFMNVRLDNCYELTRMLTMAVKGKPQNTSEKADFKGFFNYELSQEQRDECRAFMRQDELIATHIEDVIASRYKITLAKDGRADGYQATMQANDPKDPNAGLCMSAFARHWYDALAVLMYKHFVVLGKVWSKAEGQLDGRDIG